ncbi:MAG: ABC transporter permease subunit [Myxococcota bacterium]
MNSVGLIVRRELSSYLKTPGGYIIASFFLLISGVLFNVRAVGSSARYSLEVLQQYFIDAGGVVVVACVLLSLRMLAGERAMGTHVLLFTSPVREGDIVLGKYLASVIFLLVMIALSLYLPALIFVNGKVSLGHIAAGYLGMFLLGCSTLAIGMFASSMLSFNHFAAVLLSLMLTALIVSLLELGWWIGQVSEPPMNALISYMAPYMKHFHPFRRGLLQLSDLVYHGSVICFCLMGSTKILQSQRWR